MIDENKLLGCLAYDISCFEAEDKKISQLYVRADDMMRMIKDQPKIGEWIYCGDGENLPEEKINPITQDFYEYQVTFQSENIRDIRHYKFGHGHWWNGPGIMDEYVIAWRQNIEPYHEEKTEAGI